MATWQCNDRGTYSLNENIFNDTFPWEIILARSLSNILTEISTFHNIYNYHLHFNSFYNHVKQSVNKLNDAGLFLYPLKTSEKQRFSHVVRGYRKRQLSEID